MIDSVSGTVVHKDVLHYMMSLIRSARAHPKVELGPSPRAGLALKKASQAWAFMHGKGYVTPGDVKTVAPLVLTHRIISREGDPKGLLEGLINEIPVPV
jgi:MoxR-like ATPase